MFEIFNKNNNRMAITRGDIAIIEISALLGEEEGSHTFKAGDVMRFQVFSKDDCNKVYIRKDVTVEADTEIVVISLEKEDTKIGDITNKPVDYWYEVVLNPDTLF